jgi:hypothetical protein
LGGRLAEIVAGIYCSGGWLPAGFARHLLLRFAKQIVGYVISLELWQFTQRFALSFTIWKVI